MTAQEDRAFVEELLALRDHSLSAEAVITLVEEKWLLFRTLDALLCSLAGAPGDDVDVEALAESRASALTEAWKVLKKFGGNGP